MLWRLPERVSRDHDPRVVVDSGYAVETLKCVVRCQHACAIAIGDIAFDDITANHPTINRRRAEPFYLVRRRP